MQSMHTYRAWTNKEGRALGRTQHLRRLHPPSRGVRPPLPQLLLPNAGLFLPTDLLSAITASNPVISPRNAPPVQSQLRPRQPSLLSRSNERVFSPPFYFFFCFYFYLFFSFTLSSVLLLLITSFSSCLFQGLRVYIRF